jgi:hypothetical protein
VRRGMGKGGVTRFLVRDIVRVFGSAILRVFWSLGFFCFMGFVKRILPFVSLSMILAFSS